MITPRYLAPLLIGLFLPNAYAVGQDTHNRPISDTVSGTNYFIKIIPTDTSNPDNMPIVSPKGYTEVDVAPIPLNQVAPVYPAEHHSKKIEGTVWVKCLIDTSGKVVRMEIMKSDSDLLNSAAIEAARQWTFKPAMLKGKPVGTWAAIPFRFKHTK